MTKTIILIPSRLAATRLPNKPLLKVNGISIINHVYEKAKSSNIGDVFVATGDLQIFDEVTKSILHSIYKFSLSVFPVRSTLSARIRTSYRSRARRRLAGSASKLHWMPFCFANYSELWKSRGVGKSNSLDAGHSGFTRTCTWTGSNNTRLSRGALWPEGFYTSRTTLKTSTARKSLWVKRRMTSDQLSFFDRNDRERSLFEQGTPAAKPANFSLTKTVTHFGSTTRWFSLGRK